MCIVLKGTSLWKTSTMSAELSYTELHITDDNASASISAHSSNSELSRCIGYNSSHLPRAQQLGTLSGNDGSCISLGEAVLRSVRTIAFQRWRC